MKLPDYIQPEKIALKNRTWPDNIITTPPTWCSVDLRDGNQALPVPMNPDQKTEYFKMLVDIGFKEIEVSFPSASKDDFNFVRRLIEEDLIPADVRISVLTQARQHLIEDTVKSLKGVKNAILHCYVATSDLHSEMVFNKTREETKQMAIDGTKMVVEYLEKAGLRDRVAYEFSPEEFTDSDVDFVIDICEKVKEIWGPAKKEDFILNLPATVERRPPYQYADMIEYFCKNYKYRDDVSVSVHAHNDQGCAVAATEMGLLAGAERVEGTIFGHGERTGNVDLVTFALNLHARGIKTNLNFSDILSVVKCVENASGIRVHPRHPYAGELVFTAFSGSHQDAIRKGMNSLKKSSERFNVNWKVPYLHIDPADCGREYESLIRINSQSGKGGIAYVLEKDFNIRLPKGFHPILGMIVQKSTDEKGLEISSKEVLEIFNKNFVDVPGPLTLNSMKRVMPNTPENIAMNLDISLHDRQISTYGEGNGPISAVVHALSKTKVLDFVFDDYSEQSIGHGEDATALSYVSIVRKSDNKLFFGASKGTNIDHSAIGALFSAINKASTIE